MPGLIRTPAAAFVITMTACFDALSAAVPGCRRPRAEEVFPMLPRTAATITRIPCSRIKDAADADVEKRVNPGFVDSAQGGGGCSIPGVAERKDQSAVGLTRSGQKPIHHSQAPADDLDACFFSMSTTGRATTRQ